MKRRMKRWEILAAVCGLVAVAAGAGVVGYADRGARHGWHVAIAVGGLELLLLGIVTIIVVADRHGPGSL